MTEPPGLPILHAGDSREPDDEVRLYDLDSARLVVVIHLPLDVDLVAALLMAAARNGLGFAHEIRPRDVGER